MIKRKHKPSYMEEQFDLKKKLQAEKKKGNQEAAMDVMKELVMKRAEAVKDVTK